MEALHCSRPRHWRDSIVAASQPMRRLLSLIERVAPSTLPVLILGETGTGKEVLAHAIHEASGRIGPLVALNCAAVPSGLAESELFGHVRGAFTGATSAAPGLFEEANSGSLFLDEIAELDLHLQAKLLRALEEGTIRRLGATALVTIDVRIIAATSRNLAHLVDLGRFRDDLVQRLAGVVLQIPPLAQRPADVEPLARRFLHQAVGDRRPPEVSPLVWPWLNSQPWPGNVRQLKLAVERAVALGEDVLSPQHFETGGSSFRLCDSGVPEAWLENRSWLRIEREILAWAVRHYG
ncbi:MAG: sigma 54-interacting transcriptional regulator, partial [Patescibacteria group bacterium]